MNRRFFGWAIGPLLLTGCGFDPHAVPTEGRSGPKWTNASGIEFVQIPAGTFRMGSTRLSDSSPIRTVTLSSFWMSASEVTNAQYEKFRKRTRPRAARSDHSPVLGLSRQEIETYLKWLRQQDGRNYQLPTEAQWEYAARGGTEGLHFPWGNRFSEDRALIGMQGIAEGVSSPVKQYPPNAYGLYDMIGNASEPVREFYYEYKDVPGGKDPLGPLVSDDPEPVYIKRGIGIGSFTPWVWYRSPDFDTQDGRRELGLRLVIEEKRP